MAPGSRIAAANSPAAADVRRCRTTPLLTLQPVSVRARLAGTVMVANPEAFQAAGNRVSAVASTEAAGFMEVADRAAVEVTGNANYNHEFWWNYETE